MFAQSAAVSSLGKREPLDTLSAEFAFNKHFGAKVKELAAMQYNGWRRMRGDGNCYYRSVGFGWLEEILAAPRELRQAWAQDLLGKLHTVTPCLHRTQQAAHQRLVDHVAFLAAGRGWQDTSPGSEQELLEASFMDAALDQALVLALRVLIGDYLLANADDSEVCNGISFRVLCCAQGEGSPEDFCQKKVFAMGVEAETQIIRATVQALKIRLQIVIIDRAENTQLHFEDYDVVGDKGVHPLVHVQLRPGHYDLLYRSVDQEVETLAPAAPQAEEDCQRLEAKVQEMEKTRQEAEARARENKARVEEFKKASQEEPRRDTRMECSPGSILSLFVCPGSSRRG